VNNVTEILAVREFLNQRFRKVGSGARVSACSAIQKATLTSDSSTAYRVDAGRQEFVLLVSSERFPDSVAEDIRRARAMRALLGKLGYPVVIPVDEGEIEGKSYALSKRYKTITKSGIRRRLEFFQLAPHVQTWLDVLARDYSTTGPMDEYRSALSTLSSVAKSRSEVASLLDQSSHVLDSDRFRAMRMPMHGDIWTGNILYGAKGMHFKLIDFGISDINGYPLYDLVRFAMSFNFRPRRLRLALQRHRQFLGCELEDLPLYLLAALGHLAGRLGQFPVERFQLLADNCVQFFRLSWDNMDRA
jgi:Phosphotransferase enzyme family